MKTSIIMFKYNNNMIQQQRTATKNLFYYKIFDDAQQFRDTNHIIINY